MFFLYKIVATEDSHAMTNVADTRRIEMLTERAGTFWRLLEPRLECLRSEADRPPADADGRELENPRRWPRCSSASRQRLLRRGYLQHQQVRKRTNTALACPWSHIISILG